MPRKSHKNKKYTAEVREQAVKAYLKGEGSLQNICEKYGIPSKSQLHEWIKWYNGHKEIKEHSSAKGEIYMTNSRLQNSSKRGTGRFLKKAPQKLFKWV